MRAAANALEDMRNICLIHHGDNDGYRWEQHEQTPS